MTLSIIVILLLFIILYLLFMKLVFFIDTARNEYFIQAKGLVKANLEAHNEELLRIRVRALFMNFYFYPLNHIGKPKKKKISGVVVTKRRNRILIKKGIRILRTFRINKLFMNIDTGNCIINAKLYPIFTALDHHVGRFNINFQGNNQLVLHMQNRPITILKSIIKP